MQQQTNRVTVPYIQGASEAAARILSKHGISVAHKLVKTLRTTLMRHKEPNEKSNVIYGLECSQCPCEYVGETGKRLRTRMRDHKRAVRRHETTSPMWAHTAESGRTFDFDNVRMIDRGHSKEGRLLRVAWHTGSNSCNRCIELHPAYQVLRYRLNNRGRPNQCQSGTRTYVEYIGPIFHNMIETFLNRAGHGGYE